MLHSDGHNRWFDKSIQLIVCENGKAGKTTFYHLPTSHLQPVLTELSSITQVGF